jgi:2-oxoglutarate dehydrogenase E2 component (dihydrolipoamide succinyltransferase)
LTESTLADVVAPMNEEGTKATILKWGKRVGDRVSRDEPLLELETDKVTVEIHAPASGELAEILKGPDEEVFPGQVLARVRIGVDVAPAEAGTEPASGGIKPASGVTKPADNAKVPRQDGRPLLSPSVRRLLAEHEISVNDVAGTGRNGRVTAEDVVRAASGHGSVPPTAGQKPDGAEASAGSAGAPDLADPADSAGAAAGAHSRILHTPIRRRIAEHMVRSLAQAPHVTTLFEADLTRVLKHRARFSSGFEAQGVRLTLTAYFIVACARALRAHPQLNATFRDDALELHADANIGVGTALGDEGLIVPVLHRAQELNLFGVALRLGQLVAGARAGKLAPSDVRGGTFTISNHGVGGSLLAAPIVINQPQVAILGIGKVERRVCALTVDGAEMIAIRSMCYLTLTIDHRAIDAFQANAFLANVVAVLEQWPAD